MLIKIVGSHPGDNLIEKERVIGVGRDETAEDVIKTVLSKIGHVGYPAVEAGRVNKSGVFVPLQLNKTLGEIGVKNGAKIVFRRKTYGLGTLSRMDLDMDGTPLSLSPTYKKDKARARLVTLEDVSGKVSSWIKSKTHPPVITSWFSKHLEDTIQRHQSGHLTLPAALSSLRASLDDAVPRFWDTLLDLPVSPVPVPPPVTEEVKEETPKERVIVDEKPDEPAVVKDTIEKAKKPEEPPVIIDTPQPAPATDETVPKQPTETDADLAHLAHVKSLKEGKSALTFIAGDDVAVKEVPKAEPVTQPVEKKVVPEEPTAAIIEATAEEGGNKDDISEPKPVVAVPVTPKDIPQVIEDAMQEPEEPKVVSPPETLAHLNYLKSLKEGRSALTFVAGDDVPVFERAAPAPAEEISDLPAVQAAEKEVRIEEGTAYLEAVSKEGDNKGLRHLLGEDIDISEPKPVLKEEEVPAVLPKDVKTEALVVEKETPVVPEEQGHAYLEFLKSTKEGKTALAFIAGDDVPVPVAAAVKAPAEAKAPESELVALPVEEEAELPIKEEVREESTTAYLEAVSKEGDNKGLRHLLGEDVDISEPKPVLPKVAETEAPVVEKDAPPSEKEVPAILPKVVEKETPVVEKETATPSEKEMPAVVPEIVREKETTPVLPTAEQGLAYLDFLKSTKEGRSALSFIASDDVPVAVKAPEAEFAITQPVEKKTVQPEESATAYLEAVSKEGDNKGLRHLLGEDIDISEPKPAVPVFPMKDTPKPPAPFVNESEMPKPIAPEGLSHLDHVKSLKEGRSALTFIVGDDVPISVREVPEAVQPFGKHISKEPTTAYLEAMAKEGDNKGLRHLLGENIDISEPVMNEKEVPAVLPKVATEAPVLQKETPVAPEEALPKPPSEKQGHAYLDFLKSTKEGKTALTFIAGDDVPVAAKVPTEAQVPKKELAAQPVLSIEKEVPAISGEPTGETATATKGLRHLLDEDVNISEPKVAEEARREPIVQDSATAYLEAMAKEGDNKGLRHLLGEDVDISEPKPVAVPEKDTKVTEAKLEKNQGDVAFAKEDSGSYLEYVAKIRSGRSALEFLLGSKGTDSEKKDKWLEYVRCIGGGDALKFISEGRICTTEKEKAVIQELLREESAARRELLASLEQGIDQERFEREAQELTTTMHRACIATLLHDEERERLGVAPSVLTSLQNLVKQQEDIARESIREELSKATTTIEEKTLTIKNILRDSKETLDFECESALSSLPWLGHVESLKPYTTSLSFLLGEPLPQEEEYLESATAYLEAVSKEGDNKGLRHLLGEDVDISEPKPISVPVVHEKMSAAPKASSTEHLEAMAKEGDNKGLRNLIGEDTDISQPIPESTKEKEVPVIVPEVVGEKETAPVVPTTEQGLAYLDFLKSTKEGRSALTFVASADVPVAVKASIAETAKDIPTAQIVDQTVKGEQAVEESTTAYLEAVSKEGDNKGLRHLLDEDIDISEPKPVLKEEEVPAVLPKDVKTEALVVEKETPVVPEEQGHTYLDFLKSTKEGKTALTFIAGDDVPVPVAAAVKAPAEAKAPEPELVALPVEEKAVLPIKEEVREESTTAYLEAVSKEGDNKGLRHLLGEDIDISEPKPVLKEEEVPAVLPKDVKTEALVVEKETPVVPEEQGHTYLDFLKSTKEGKTALTFIAGDDVPVPVAAAVKVPAEAKAPEPELVALPVEEKAEEEAVLPIKEEVREESTTAYLEAVSKEGDNKGLKHLLGEDIDISEPKPVLIDQKEVVEKVIQVPVQDDKPLEQDQAHLDHVKDMKEGESALTFVAGDEVKEAAFMQSEVPLRSAVHHEPSTAYLEAMAKESDGRALRHLLGEDVDISELEMQHVSPTEYLEAVAKEGDNKGLRHLLGEDTDISEPVSIAVPAVPARDIPQPPTPAVPEQNVVEEAKPEVPTAQVEENVSATAYLEAVSKEGDNKGLRHLLGEDVDISEPKPILVQEAQIEVGGTLSASATDDKDEFTEEKEEPAILPKAAENETPAQAYLDFLKGLKSGKSALAFVAGDNENRTASQEHLDHVRGMKEGASALSFVAGDEGMVYLEYVKELGDGVSALDFIGEKEWAAGVRKEDVMKHIAEEMELQDSKDGKRTAMVEQLTAGASPATVSQAVSLTHAAQNECLAAFETRLETSEDVSKYIALKQALDEQAEVTRLCIENELHTPQDSDETQKTKIVQVMKLGGVQGNLECLKYIASLKAESSTALEFIQSPSKTDHLDFVKSLGSGSALGFISSPDIIAPTPSVALPKNHGKISRDALLKRYNEENLAECACCDLESCGVLVVNDKIVEKLKEWREIANGFVHIRTGKKVRDPAKEIAKGELTISQKLAHLKEWKKHTKGYYVNKALKQSTWHVEHEISKLTRKATGYPEAAKLPVLNPVFKAALESIIARDLQRIEEDEKKRLRKAENRVMKLNVSSLIQTAMEKGKWKLKPVLGSDQKFYHHAKRGIKVWDLGEQLVADTQEKYRKKQNCDFYPPNCLKCNVSYGFPPPRWCCTTCKQEVWQPSTGVKSRYCHCCEKDISRTQIKPHCSKCGYICCKVCTEHEVPLVDMGWSGRTRRKVCLTCAEK